MSLEINGFSAACLAPEGTLGLERSGYPILFALSPKGWELTILNRTYGITNTSTPEAASFCRNTCSVAF
jgi:hypothetical protein